jgi:hypothetical protein
MIVVGVKGVSNNFWNQIDWLDTGFVDALDKIVTFGIIGLIALDDRIFLII